MKHLIGIQLEAKKVWNMNEFSFGLYNVASEFWTEKKRRRMRKYFNWLEIGAFNIQHHSISWLSLIGGGGGSKKSNFIMIFYDDSLRGSSTHGIWRAIEEGNFYIKQQEGERERDWARCLLKKFFIFLCFSLFLIFLRRWESLYWKSAQ